MSRYKIYTKEKGIVEADNFDDIQSLTLHRLDGPALTEYYHNENILCEEYMVDGELCNLNGPAFIVYHQDGSVKYETYYISGIRYNYETYHKKILKYKFNLLK